MYVLICDCINKIHFLNNICHLRFPTCHLEIKIFLKQSGLGLNKQKKVILFWDTPLTKTSNFLTDFHLNSLVGKRQNYCFGTEKYEIIDVKKTSNSLNWLRRNGIQNQVICIPFLSNLLLRINNLVFIHLRYAIFIHINPWQGKEYVPMQVMRYLSAGSLQTLPSQYLIFWNVAKHQWEIIWAEVKIQKQLLTYQFMTVF